VIAISLQAILIGRPWLVLTTGQYFLVKFIQAVMLFFYIIL